MKPRSASCTVPSWSSENESISFTCTIHTLRALSTMPRAGQRTRQTQPPQEDRRVGTQQPRGAPSPSESAAPSKPAQRRLEWWSYSAASQVLLDRRVEAVPRLAVGVVHEEEVEVGVRQELEAVDVLHCTEANRQAADDQMHRPDQTIRDPCGCGAYRILRGSACRRRRSGRT